MPDVGTFQRHPALAALPPLVRKQRKLAKQIAPLGPLEEQDKALRKDIDALLLKAGLATNDCVTCNGYDVTRRGQKGRSSINETTLVLLLVEAGLTQAQVLHALRDSTETADPSAWAEVKPSKGATVRK